MSGRPRRSRASRNRPLASLSINICQTTVAAAGSLLSGSTANSHINVLLLLVIVVMATFTQQSPANAHRIIMKCLTPARHPGCVSVFADLLPDQVKMPSLLPNDPLPGRVVHSRLPW